MAEGCKPDFYVVLSNASSKQNLGTYLRTASAFNAKQVVVGESIHQKRCDIVLVSVILTFLQLDLIDTVHMEHIELISMLMSFNFTSSIKRKSI